MHIPGTVQPPDPPHPPLLLNHCKSLFLFPIIFLSLSLNIVLSPLQPLPVIPFSQPNSKSISESPGAWQIRFLLKRSPGSPATERETFCFHYSSTAAVHHPRATPNGHNTLRQCSGGMHGSLRRGVVLNTSHCTAQMERYTTAQGPDYMFSFNKNTSNNP